MSYQALLFCPDDKTARTVTQVLSELEFKVESCTEPFAAVKKLMGEHFDAVVVDCDNEQNATLLFKSARNSTSNQASLAVAVVEGQAGVAKAFRIGANLVLTKPINVDQAKGTLRVARGLLRKGDGGKPAAAAAPAASSPAAPLPAPSAAPIAPPKPAAPAAPRASSIPAPVRPAVKTDAAAPASRSIVPPGIVPAPEKKIAVPAAQIAPSVTAQTPPVAPAAVERPVAKPALPSAPANFGGAAASAPAPAREPAASTPAIAPADDDDILETSAAPQTSAASASAREVPAPTFTFGGANAPAESSGGSKKIIAGIAAVLVVGALAYAGWTYYSGHKSSSPNAQPPVHQATTQPAPAAPAAAPAATAAQPSTSDANASTPAESAPVAETVPDITLKSAPIEKPSKSPTPSKATATASPAEAPLVIKGGAAPKEKSGAAAPDAPAPSVIGIDSPASSASVAKIVDSGSTQAPVLQKLNISQGVSLGLLLKRVDPVYPSNAVRMHIEGSVLLDATISKTGDITNLKVLKGDPMLTRAATDAVKQWRYAPYLLNGEPVEIQTQITIKFKLPSQ